MLIIRPDGTRLPAQALNGETKPAMAPGTKNQRPQAGLPPVPGARHAPLLTSRTELALPANRAAMVNVAIKLAGLTWHPELSDRIQASLRQVLERQPRALPLRVTRLLLELERAGGVSDAARFLQLLELDGFAALMPPAADAQTGDFSSSGQPDGGHGKPDDSEDSPPGQQRMTAANGSVAPMLEPPRKSGETGPSGWTWLSLPPRDGNLGGSLRLRSLADGHDVALDILTDAGCWEFYWSEPGRRVLYYHAPEQSTEVSPKLDVREMTPMLKKILGNLGFVKYQPIHDTDWIDGFNFFEIDSILGRVDMVV